MRLSKRCLFLVDYCFNNSSKVATVFEAVSCASPADPKKEPSLDYNVSLSLVDTLIDVFILFTVICGNGG